MQTFVQIADAGSLTAAARAHGHLAAGRRARAGRLRGRSWACACSTAPRGASRSPKRAGAPRTAAGTCWRRWTTPSPRWAADAAEPAGHLTITAPVLFGQMYVAPAVTRFVQRHPRMRCTVLLLDRVVNLLEEGLDVGIRIGRAGGLHRWWRSVWARSAAWSWPARPTCAARRAAPPERPAAAPIACASSRARPPWGDFQENGTRVPGAPSAATWSSTTSAPRCRPAPKARASACSSRTRWRPWSRRRSCGSCWRNSNCRPRPISIVYPHARLLPARTRSFIDFVREEITQFAGRGPSGRPG